MYITHLGDIDPRKIKSVGRPKVEIQTIEHLGKTYNTGKSIWIPIEIVIDATTNAQEMNDKLIHMKDLRTLYVDLVEDNEIKESWIIGDPFVYCVSNINDEKELVVTINYNYALLLM